MRWPFTSIKNASGSPQIQSAARCGGPAFADPALAASADDGLPAKAADQMALCRTADRVSRITREFSMDRFAARRRVLLRRRMKLRRAVWQGRHWMPMQ